jgi:hypothetical protein
VGVSLGTGTLEPRSAILSTSGPKWQVWKSRREAERWGPGGSGREGAPRAGNRRARQKKSVDRKIITRRMTSTGLIRRLWVSPPLLKGREAPAVMVLQETTGAWRSHRCCGGQDVDFILCESQQATTEGSRRWRMALSACPLLQARR